MKKRKNEDLLLYAGITFLAGLWLKSNPHCDSGCQTVAEHLIKHGLSGLLGA